MADSHGLDPQAFGSLPLSLADAFIEQTIGFFGVPWGIVTDVWVNGTVYTVPVVTEETSVVAALQKTAHWVKRQQGDIEATSSAPQLMIGQIHIPRLKDADQLKAFVAKEKARLLDAIHQGPCHAMHQRGGGCQDIVVRTLARPDGGFMGVMHVHVDVCAAMGANLVTQICEFLKPLIAAGTGETLGMAILSNLADQKLTQVRVRVPGVPKAMGEALQEASLFAQLDPYRAVTHNKGLLNGMDGVAVATGNDWRALEAGLHGFAARTGSYRGLSTWTYDAGQLEGVFEGPVTVGLVGGVTGVHPGAQGSLKILGVKTAAELAQIIASVGMLQNLGALRALVGGGLVQGHMALHLDNLLLGEGASAEERVTLKPLLRKLLKEKGYVRREDVAALLIQERGT